MIIHGGGGGGGDMTHMCYRSASRANIPVNAPHRIEWLQKLV